jgi:hypothetical protein
MQTIVISKKRESQEKNYTKESIMSGVLLLVVPILCTLLLLNDIVLPNFTSKASNMIYIFNIVIYTYTLSLKINRGVK